jgi:hypothetical protein
VPALIAATPAARHQGHNRLADHVVALSRTFRLPPDQLAGTAFTNNRPIRSLATHTCGRTVIAARPHENPGRQVDRSGPAPPEAGQAHSGRPFRDHSCPGSRVGRALLVEVILMLTETQSYVSLAIVTSGGPQPASARPGMLHRYR